MNGWDGTDAQASRRWDGLLWLHTSGAAATVAQAACSTVWGCGQWTRAPGLTRVCSGAAVLLNGRTSV